MALDKYFKKQTAHWIPPEVQRWHSRGLKLKRCEFVRERDGLAFRPAKLVLSFVPTKSDLVDRVKADRVKEVELWNTRLNQWIMEQGPSGRTVTTENEGERFGFLLRERFAPIEQRYGDGFFNSVLLRDLRDDPELASRPPVHEALACVSAPKPRRSSAERDCSRMLQEVLGTCGTELVELLEYKKDKAEAILCDAIAYFLDERFSITNSRILGLLG